MKIILGILCYSSLREALVNWERGPSGGLSVNAQNGRPGIPAQNRVTRCREGFDVFGGCGVSETHADC
jgi:hypothetical protein